MSGNARDDEVREELREIIQRMVSRQDDVELEAQRQGSTTVFQLRLPAGELGKVIGRQGRTARALRTLLDTRGDYEGRRYALEIRES